MQFLTPGRADLRMSMGMDIPQLQDRTEGPVHRQSHLDQVLWGTDETWQDIVSRYRVLHQGPASVLDAVEDLLLALEEALTERASREHLDGQVALARRTVRYAQSIHDLYVLTETAAQAQLGAAALSLGAPAWLFLGDEGAAWKREITALADYAAWADATS